MGFILSHPSHGQRSVDSSLEKAIPNIDTIRSEIDSLPETDVRENISPEKLDTPKDRVANSGGRIYTSRNVEVMDVKHWKDDSSPFAIDFKGKGTIALNLQERRFSSDESEKSKLRKNKDVHYVSAVVQPALSKDPNELSYLFVEGAAIGFGLKPEGSGLRMGTAFVLNGDSKEANLEDWFGMGVNFMVNEKYEAALPLHLALRIDPQASEWDLYVSGRLQFAGISYGKPNKDLSYHSSGNGLTRLGELAVYSQNPFFEDSDSDGIEDAIEESLGFSSQRNDRYEHDELGEFTNIQHFINLRKIHVSRAERELEATLLEAVATSELGREPSAELKAREVPKEIRDQAPTEEEYETQLADNAKRFGSIGRKPDIRSENETIVEEVKEAQP